MCGITGFNWEHEGIAKIAANSISHRGLDSSGVWSDRKVTFGFRRLSILDLSAKGNQPMVDDHENYVIVFNGELYNFQKIRGYLEQKGYKFNSTTDTEVILNAYKHFGSDCVKQFNGMWAFCIYDREKEQLFLSRDRHGKKPLYYYFDGRRFIFGSEIKTILTHSSIQKEINQQALEYYLAYGFIPEPLSIFKKISKLEPGCNLFFDLKKTEIRKERYWTLDFGNKKDISLKDAASELKRLFEDSIKLRLIADVPVGTFLSGGVDSSIVTSEIVRIRKEKTAQGLGLGSNETTHSFSIGFKDKDFDETNYALKMADLLGTEHHVEVLDEKRSKEIFEKLVNYYDEPFADSSMIPTFAVSELARKHVKVVLSGDGSDETFAGYGRYVLANFLSKFPKAMIPLLSVSGKVAKIMNMNTAALAFEQSEAIKMGSNGKIFAKLMSHSPADFIKGKENVYSDAFVYKDKIDNYLNSSLKYLTGDILTKVDRASMAVSLETRCPFLDVRITEFSAGLPSKFKMSGMKQKIVLREAFKNQIPNEILNRDKMGFSIPISKYIIEQNDVEQSIKDLCNKSWFKFDKFKLLGVLDEHKQNKRDRGGFLYSLLFLDKWAKRYDV